MNTDETTQNSNEGLSFEKSLFDSLKVHGFLFPVSKREIEIISNKAELDDKPLEIDLAALRLATTKDLEVDMGIAAFSDSESFPDISADNIESSHSEEE